MKNNISKSKFLFFVFLNLYSAVYSQNTASKDPERHFGGAVTVTNKGVSFIPNFTLGKPAVIFDLSMGSKNLSFEPQLRFALEGKPWSFLFWWRYKLLEKGRFKINIGAHPALSFKTKSFLVNNIAEEHMVVHRYLAGELSPGYFLAKNTSIGIYYLFSHGFEKEAVRNTQFVALRTNFSNIRLSARYFIKFNPQIYYLRMNKDDGFYYSASLTMARTNFPVSISGMINNPINTNISAGNEFIWNISLIYSFNKQYFREK